MSAEPEPAATGADPAPVTYVYGLTTSGVPMPDGPPRLPGGGPVRAVDFGELRAVVCTLDPRVLEAVRAPGIESVDVLTATARGHDTTLSMLAQDRPVVPLRLGTVVSGDSAVRDLLERHADALRAELDRVDSSAEWAVKVHLREPSGGAEPVAEPVPASKSPGRDYLAQRRASLRGTPDGPGEHRPAADEIHERLAACATKADLVATGPVDDHRPPLLHGVYLLDRDERERFEAVVADLRTRNPGVRIEASGPWPPYHFTSVRIGGEEGAPA